MLTQKIAAYLRSARIQRGLNLRGVPLIPKSISPGAPCNRLAYNEFVSWIHQFQLPDVKQVVDVGANHGDFSQASGALFPAAKVLLVEPLPTLHAELERCGAERGRRWRLATCALRSTKASAGPTDPFILCLLRFFVAIPIAGFRLKAPPGISPDVAGR